jgi:hypothetical protein
MQVSESIGAAVKENSQPASQSTMAIPGPLWIDETIRFVNLGLRGTDWHFIHTRGRGRVRVAPNKTHADAFVPDQHFYFRCKLV